MCRTLSSDHFDDKSFNKSIRVCHKIRSSLKNRATYGGNVVNLRCDTCVQYWRSPMLRQSDDINILKSTEAPRLTAPTGMRWTVHSPLKLSPSPTLIRMRVSIDNRQTISFRELEVSAALLCQPAQLWHRLRVAGEPISVVVLTQSCCPLYMFRYRTTHS